MAELYRMFLQRAKTRVVGSGNLLLDAWLASAGNRGIVLSLGRAFGTISPVNWSQYEIFEPP
jgi:hypothetical protein